MRSLKAIPVVAAGFLVGVLPAMGASKEVTNNGTTWNPNAVSIAVGDDVKFNWTFSHNVAFQDGPRSGEVTLNGGSFERRFDTAGTFRFRCEAHSDSFTSGMTGTVTVSQSGTGTTITDTTMTETSPTNTTPTNTTTTPADSTGPVITALRRRAGRTVLRVSFSSDEDGTLGATVRRRNPGARAFRVVARRTAGFSKGSNIVTLQRASRGLRRGAYRVTLVFADDSGNESRSRTLVFKIA